MVTHFRSDKLISYTKLTFFTTSLLLIQIFAQKFTYSSMKKRADIEWKIHSCFVTVDSLLVSVIDENLFIDSKHSYQRRINLFISYTQRLNKFCASHTLTIKFCTELIDLWTTSVPLQSFQHSVSVRYSVKTAKKLHFCHFEKQKQKQVGEILWLRRD